MHPAPGRRSRRRDKNASAARTGCRASAGARASRDTPSGAGSGEPGVTQPNSGTPRASNALVCTPRALRRKRPPCPRAPTCRPATAAALRGRTRAVAALDPRAGSVLSRAASARGSGLPQPSRRSGPAAPRAPPPEPTACGVAASVRGGHRASYSPCHGTPQPFPARVPSVPRPFRPTRRRHGAPYPPARDARSLKVCAWRAARLVGGLGNGRGSRRTPSRPR